MTSRFLRLRGGFTLIELLVVIAIIALLIGILLPAVGQARDQAKVMQNMNNMSQFGKTLGTYGGDYKDKIYSFSWRKNNGTGDQEFRTEYADIKRAANDVEAAAWQAVDIIRRRGDRTASGTSFPGFPKISGWIPHPYYTHLVLQDYLNARLPDRTVVSPFDRFRLEAQDRFREFTTSTCPVTPGVSGSNFHRWPYSSSYNNVIASFDKSPTGDRLSIDTWGFVNMGDPKRMNLGNQNLADVSFAAQKVLTFEAHRWYPRAKQSWFNYDDVSMPLAFFDSSVRVMKIGSCNAGWDPNSPAGKNPVPIEYRNSGIHPFEPRARSQTGTDLSVPRFLLTRGGLKGVDFGGSEVGTGQPNN